MGDWREKARQAVMGERHVLDSLPGYWIRAKRFTVTAAEEIREAEHLPPALLRKVARIKPDTTEADKKAFEQRAVQELTDEEFSLLSDLQTSLDPKIARLRMVHGIGEHNFTDTCEASKEVTTDFVDELLGYSPVALEILEEIARVNPGPFSRGKSQPSNSSSSGSSREPQTSTDATSPTMPSGMTVTGAITPSDPKS